MRNTIAVGDRQIAVVARCAAKRRRTSNSGPFGFT
jgi:hypothetical protein